MFHKHKWIIIKQETHPAGIELLEGDIDVRGYDLFKKDVIVNYRCEKCGTEKVTRI
jgi:hypothetical protein